MGQQISKFQVPTWGGGPGQVGQKPTFFLLFLALPLVYIIIKMSQHNTSIEFDMFDGSMVAGKLHLTLFSS